MYIIDKNRLNPLEQQIFSRLFDEIRQNDCLSILEAAELCGCSPSKISKFVTKLGFKNYKEYVGFFSSKNQSIMADETERIMNFLQDFTPEIIQQFVAYMRKFERIVLFGYGPSLIVAQYFEYKLRTIANISVWAVPDETSCLSLVDKDCLVIVCSVAGKFISFQKLYEAVNAKNGRVAFVLEEPQSDFLAWYDYVVILSEKIQVPNRRPHEKSRTMLMIFIEAIINQWLTKELSE